MLHQNKKMLSRFQEWRVDSSPLQGHKLLNFGVWGGKFSTVATVLEGLAANLDIAKLLVRIDVAKSSPATLPFLNEIVRMPWFHLSVLTDFVNIYTGQPHEIKFELTDPEHKDTCLCARAKPFPGLQQPTLGPVDSLTWPYRFGNNQVEEVSSGGLAREPVRCQGCAQMFVLHQAYPPPPPRHLAAAQPPAPADLEEK